jgi:hypothetical protein
MTLRSPTIATLAILGMVCAGHGADPDAPSKNADAKVKHPPISALRQRMLEQFHGQTTDTFTAISGFGMERMVPLYKLVPFEIPDLSTNEVEVVKEIVPPQPLKDVFSESLDGFRHPGKPVVKKNQPNAPFNPNDGFGIPNRVVMRGLQLRLLDLVGLINADGPRVYSGGKAFEVQRMNAEEAKAFRETGKPAVNPFQPRFMPPKARKSADDARAKAEPAKLETRPLDVFETTGVAELRDGKELFIRTRGNAIRMLGALRATEQCLECHTDSKRGDLLGAFSYTFVDVNNALAKQLNTAPAK